VPYDLHENGTPPQNTAHHAYRSVALHMRHSGVARYEAPNGGGDCQRMERIMTYDIHQVVTDAVLAKLQTAKAGDWAASWSQNVPQNIDGRAYSGINRLLLGISDYTSQTFGTYKAWQAAGSQVRRGERSTTIVFYKSGTRAQRADDDASVALDGRVSYRVARGYNVFAAEQVDGDAADTATTQTLPNVAAPIETVDAVTSAYSVGEGVPIVHEGSRAYYRPSTDTVVLPPMPAFNSTEGYYATLLHELAHSTGTAARCNRDKGNTRHGYAFEELVAELGAAMLCASLSVSATPRDDHAQYLASWLKILMDDKRAIFRAAAAAQRAADFVLAYREAA
jgi:antirestriction protein ArdC